MEQTLHAVEALMRELLHRQDFVLRPEMTAQDVKGWDSLRHIQLIVEIEKKLGVRLEPRDVVRAKTFGDLVEIIHQRPRNVA